MPRLAPAVFVAAALMLAASVANAQVYKWKDANGTTHYSDQPPSGSHYDKVQINGSVPTPGAHAPAPATASTAASTAANKPAPASTAGKAADTPDNRAKLCKNLGSNIALLNSQQSLTISGDNGAQKSLSDDERRQQLATAQAQQKQYCGGG